jgi:hypothetical protein
MSSLCDELVCTVLILSPEWFVRKYTNKLRRFIKPTTRSFLYCLFLKDRMDLRVLLYPLGEKLLDEFREVLPGASIF